MDRRLVFGLALAAGLAACNDQPQEQSPQGPNLAVNATDVCAPNGFNSLIAGYFSSAQQQTVKNYKDAMLAALPSPDSATARTNAFNILREIAAAAKATPQPPAATGSELTVEVLKCVFDVKDTLVIKPKPSAGTFTNSLDHAAGGGYEIRGLAAVAPDPGDPTGVVQAVTGGVVIGAVAPPPAPPPPPTVPPPTWDEVLQGNRVLFYGEHVAADGDGTYHWSMVPRGVTFGSTVVTTCFNDNGDASQMLTESDVGVLAFVEASYMCIPPAVASLGGSGTFALFRRLANFGRDLLVPEPANATVLTAIVGGSAKGKSVFGPKQVKTVTVTTSVVPSPLIVNTGAFSLTITVKTGTGANALLADGMKAVLGAINNNGTPTKVVTCGTTDVPTGITGTAGNSPGTLTLTPLCITKTGKVKVSVTVTAEGRSGTGSGLTNATQVRPN